MFAHQVQGKIMVRIPIILAGAMFVAVSANAASLDLSTIKCKDFVADSKDNIAIIITWLDGYYKEKDDPPVIDFDKFTTNSAKLGKFCGENPDLGLITAADKTLGK